VKKALSLIFLLLLSVVPHLAAQTTYTITNAPISTGHTSFTPFRAFTLTLTGTGNEISWMQGTTDTYHPTECSSGGNGTGFVYLTLGGVQAPCASATSFQTSGSTHSSDGKCSGPASATEQFAGGEITVYFGYYYGGYGRSAGCYNQVISGEVTLQ